MEIAANVATVVALAVGGWWTYRLFVRQRLGFPRAELDISLDHAVIAPDKRLLHAVLTIRNTGSILLRPRSAELRLRQVVPVDPAIASRFAAGFDPVAPGTHELPWPLISRREWADAFEVEPGEADTLHADFIIDTDVQLIQLYAFVANPTQRRQAFGWAITRFVSLSKDVGALRDAPSPAPRSPR